MSCEDCSQRTRVDISSAGEVEFCNGCAIIPDEIDIIDILKKKDCRLADVIRKVSNLPKENTKKVKEFYPYRVMSNTREYKIQYTGNKGGDWFDLRYRDFLDIPDSYEMADEVRYFKSEDDVKTAYRILIDEYRFNKIKDIWKPINL